MDVSPAPDNKTEIKRKTGHKKQKGQTSERDNSNINLSPNMAALLCYLGVWISGIIFLVLEQKNKFVRFHAAQSIIVFGSLNIIGLVLGNIPVVGWYFNLSIGILYIIFWIVLMIKAYNSELYKLPLAGNLAEKLEAITFSPGKNASVNTVTRETEPEKSQQPAQPSTEKKSVPKEEHDFLHSTRTGRTVTSCMAIFWYFLWLIFLNYYYKFIAFYHFDKSGNYSHWVREPILTADYFFWLPQINVALVLAIIGNIITIIIDRYVVYEIINILINLFIATAIGLLLATFPFNFSALSDPVMATSLPSISRLVLLIIIVAIVIAIIVRAIRLILSFINKNA